MPRPLAHKSINQLEAMYERNRSVRAELLLLVDELGHRSTQRAKDLLKNVKSRLRHLAAGDLERQSRRIQEPYESRRRGGEKAMPDKDPIDPQEAEWLRLALGKLRDKLIDLSKRNPLVSFKHSERGASYLRIIDELPDHLFQALQEGEMTFEPLPTANETPRDELTHEFRIAWERAKLTDSQYLDELEKLGEEVNDEEKVQAVERALRARVRAELGLPRIDTGRTIDIAALARAHGFDPSFELSEEGDRDEHHLTDNKIRVLLTADRLETRLRTIHDRYKSHAAETGLHTLYVAFGFVEWFEDDQSSIPLHAPALILPVQLERRLERSRYVFSLSARDEDLQINMAMRELLKQKFKLEAPKLRDNETPESYFIRFKGVLDEDHRLRLSLRRFVTLAVLPFPRMVLWQDLDPEIWPEGCLDGHALLPQLLGAREAQGGGDFLADYPIDDPEMATRVPPLVLDADASQHSALIDVAEGRSLAIEGPPGTGKSQTITNMIAATLDRGKRVLFVAEKQAALDVVAKRLKDVGFEPLLLHLHSDRATKQELLREVRQRLDAKAPRDFGQLESLKAELQEKKDLLRRYLALLDKPLGRLGRTAHKLAWRELALRQICLSVPAALQNRQIDTAETLDELGMSRARTVLVNISEKSADIIERYGRIDGSPWCAAKSLSTFDQTAAIEAAKKALDEYEKLLRVAAQVDEQCGITLPDDESSLVRFAERMSHLPEVDGFSDGELRAVLREPDGAEALVSRWSSWRNAKNAVEQLHDSPLSADSEALELLASLLESEGRLPQSLDDARSELNDVDDQLTTLAHLQEAMEPVFERFGLSENSSSQHVLLVCSALSEITSLPTESFELRSESLLDEHSETAIAAARHEADDLALRATEAAEKLRIEDALAYDANRIVSLVETIETAGFLNRLLSGTYKAAWREVSRLFHQPPDRMAAVDELRRLQRLIEDRRRFADSSPVRTYFSHHWRGAESDWQALQTTQEVLASIADRASLMRFDAVAELVAGEGGRSLRRLAAVAETASADLTVLPETPSQATLEEMRNRWLLDRERLHSLIQAAEAVGIRSDASLLCGSSNCARTIAAFQEADRSMAEKPGSDAAWDWYRWPDTKIDPVESALRYVGSFEADEVDEEIGRALQETQSPVTGIARMRAAGKNLLGPIAECQQAIRDLCTLVEAEPAEFLGIGGDGFSVRGTRDLLRTAASDEDGIRLYADHGRYLREAESEGCRFVYDECFGNGMQLVHLADLYELLVVRSLLRKFLDAGGRELERLGGLGLAKARERFAELDDELQKVEARRIAAQRLQRDRAPEGTNRGPRGSWTELALLRLEAGKQKRHIPIRQLVHRAGRALAALKPVWMMSPTSVAQYIQPGSIEFDLVVIDEASQMRPEFAVGAIARGAQLVVVGDSNQLPPTDFFNVHGADPSELGEDEDFDIDTESVLDLANERLPFKRALNWHYRSEHESLIQFSNRRFYDRRLVVFPSPTTDDALLGVKHSFVEGVYEAQINQKEAQAVIEEAIGIMVSRPELSMGIATMNIKQRDLIWTEFERLAAQDRVVQSYVERHAGTIEPFFIKNLENVQGDERDVILISTVYGPDNNGHVFQRFGPLNSKVGHRRLNVLITRAKQTTRVFTSLHPDDIKIAERTNEGVQATQAYLRYSAGGAEFEDASGGEPDSDFEIFVADRLRGSGYEVVHQVGVEGFRIDLGVRHPDFPLGFIAGIECDGATYHSGLTIRDRDKIRQAILEKLGWKIYRIWSTDWFVNPELQTGRLLNTLARWRDQALASYAARQQSGEFVAATPATTIESVPTPTPEREVATSRSADLTGSLIVASSTEPEEEAQSAERGERVPAGRHRQLDDIDWYEAMRGALFEVWPDGEYGGDVEVLSRSSSAPRLYGGAIAIQRSEYQGVVEATGEKFIVDDLYAAVREVARLARAARAPSAGHSATPERE